MDPTLSPHETIHELGRIYVAFAEDHPRLYKVYVEELVDTQTSLRMTERCISIPTTSHVTTWSGWSERGTPAPPTPNPWR